MQQFRHAHYTRYQTSRTEVSFSVGTFDYTVFDYQEAQETPPRVRGVSVGRTGAEAPSQQWLCGPKASSRLHMLQGLLPCDADNALASCP